MTRAALLAGMAAAGLAVPASADVLRATREQPLVEISHSVDIRIDRGVATYKVRRLFANGGKVADEVGLAIYFPAGGAATGLRIRAHEVWYDGELMERERAAALYHELTGMGAYAPKDPALLQWQWADKLYLQIFPVMPGQVSTVEYTVTAPTRYASGRYWISYPRIDASATTSTLATPIVTVTPTWGTAATAIVIDGKRAAPGVPVVLLPPVREGWLDGIGADPNASYVSSVLTVPASSHTTKEFTKGSVTVNISHTYKSDLRIALLTPDAKSIDLFRGTGGGDNNIHTTFPVTLPPKTHGAGTWRLVVSDHAALDTGSIDSWELALGDGANQERLAASDVPIFIPDAPESASDAGVASIAIAPPAFEIWTARLGRVVASETHAFTRLEVDVAPQVRPLPKKAQVVFAIDASWTIGDEGLAGELDVVRAYASHVPDAEIEVVAYRRRATRVFGRFVRGTEVDTALSAAKTAGALALGNGSALDDGARLAASLVAARKGPRRIVLVTDDLTRTRLDDALALAALAGATPDTIVHVVRPTGHDDRVTLERDDTDHFAPLATKHHGIFATIAGVPARTLKDVIPVTLELVRPTRIDQLAVDGVAVDDKLLPEGSGLRIMAAGKTAATRVVLSGKLWSDPIRREVMPTDLFSRQTAAFVFGLDEHHDLSPAEMMTVAMMGRAVSPVTSYVAFEPGTRPSTIGLEQGTFGFGRTGFGAGGSGAGYGAGVARRPPNLRSLVDTRACIASVKPAAGWTAAFDVETTRDEVVDVSAQSGQPAMATCLAEAVWALRLPAQFDLQREQFHLQFND